MTDELTVAFNTIGIEVMEDLDALDELDEKMTAVLHATDATEFFTAEETAK